MEEHKVVSASNLSEWVARKYSKLSPEFRDLKIKELGDNLFHLCTLPLGKENPAPLEGQVKAGKFDLPQSDLVIGKINRNRIVSGSNRQNIRKAEDVLLRLSDKSDNNYITNDLRKEYQARELDLCGFLDRTRWRDEAIYTMRRIVAEMEAIFDLAGMQGIQIDPIFVGLHRLDSELRNCTKRDLRKRKNAQHNLKVELFRIRKRSMGIERDCEIPSYEDFLSTKFGLDL